MTSKIKAPHFRRPRLIALPFFLLVLMGACKKLVLDSAVKIVGGSNSIPTNHPGNSSTVAVVLEDISVADQSATCTGTVIAKDLILTAAHCVENAKKDILKIYVTENTEGGRGKVLRKIRVSDFLGFPKFRGYETDDVSFDIAWIKLAEPVPDFAVPVPIVVDEKLLASQTPVDLAGYGRITTTFNALPFEKRFVTVHLDKFYNKAPFYSLVFFREPGKGMCWGDSGGPLFIKVNGKWALAGVTKGLIMMPFGRSTGCSDAGIYTFPGMYIDWLERTSETKLVHVGKNKSEQISETWSKENVTSIEQLCEKNELSKDDYVKLASIHYKTEKIDCNEAIKSWKANK